MLAGHAHPFAVHVPYVLSHAFCLATNAGSGVGAGVAVSSGSSEGVGVGVELISGTASVSAVSGSSLYSELVSGSVLIRPSGTPIIFGIAASGFGRSSSVI